MNKYVNYLKTKFPVLVNQKSNNKDVKLSVLICSILQRSHMLQKLLSELCSNKTQQVQIIINIDNKELTIGQKRQKLLQMSSGKYVQFLDDDDSLSPDSFRLIMQKIKQDRDCIAISGFMTTNRKNPMLFSHNLYNDHWEDRIPDAKRLIGHLNPVKRELAIQVGFSDKKYGQDVQYAIKLRPLLKTQSIIEKPIYFYNFCRK